jgi:hypothetical protein
MKKQHPSSERDAKVLAEAVEFSATILPARGLRDTRHRKALSDAALEAAAMERAWPGKRALVYALNAQGHQVLVPRETWLEKAINAQGREVTICIPGRED